MSDWTPGADWRLLEPDERPDLAPGATVLHETVIGDRADRTWVREQLVPPLPTEPYTVIRATWRPDQVKETYVLSHALKKWTNVNNGIQHTPEELLGGITGFEVLAEPLMHAHDPGWNDHLQRRDAEVGRETARAVLARLASFGIIDGLEPELRELRDLYRLDS